MLDVVTFETAKRLKAAGFPQGGWHEGVALYSSTGEKFIIGKDVSNGFSIVNEWTVCSVETLEDDDFFAPSPTDILKELGEDYSLRIVLYFTRPCEWCCFIGQETWEHEKPAEACAAAWLSIHEKTTP